jgi:hypothetical protein
VFARPIVDAEDFEPELAFGDVAFPSRLQALRTFSKDGVPSQRAVLMTGQFFSSNPGANGAGVQRLYSRIGARVLRSTSDDYVPPAFTRIDATKVDTTAAFAVDVSDLNRSGNPGVVKRVLVAVRSGSATTWTFTDLGQAAPGSARWAGGVPLTGSTFEYFVQAVDAAGNVAVSTNKGFYFAAAAPVAPSGNIDVEPAVALPASGWFTGATATRTTGPANVTLEVSVDGGPFAAVPQGGGPTVAGDGVHTVEARGSNGGTDSTLVPIDSQAPTITIGAPLDGSAYTLGATTPTDYRCADSGSGVKTCAGTLAFGAPFAGTAGSRTLTVTAVDNVGNTTSRSVSFKVFAFSGFFQPVDNLPILNVAKAGSAVPIKFGLGGNFGLSIFRSGYPAATKVACGSTVILDDIEELTTNSGLQYDATNSRYQYNWKTPKAYAGSCYTIELGLIDGSSRSALFRFK